MNKPTNWVQAKVMRQKEKNLTENANDLKSAVNQAVADMKTVGELTARNLAAKINDLPSIKVTDPHVNIRIKYLDGADRMEMKEHGAWIDCYAYEDYDFEPGDFKLVNLGFACEMPQGFEGNIVPRSSTFKKYGLIQTNHYAVIDPTYCGDNDVWMWPAYATRACHISKGDRICQFRLNAVQYEVQFKEVDELGNPDRNGFGSTGV